MANDVLTDVLQGQDPALSPVDTQTPPSPLLPAGVPILPAPGANADLTDTSAPDLGSATLGAQLAAKGSPFLKALTQGSDAAATAQQKNGTANQPGAWARSLVSGASHALSGIEGSLSDFAATAQPVPAGSGKLGSALLGISSVAQARQQRQSNEQNQKLATAQANIQMRHQQLLNSQLSKAANDADTASGVQGLAVLSSLPAQLETVGTDMTAADMTAAMKSGQANASDYTAYHTGNKIIGHDENGDIYQPTYTVVKLPDQVTFKSGDPAKQAELTKQAEFIKYYTGKDLIGAPSVTGSDFNRLWQQASNAQTAQAARDDAAEKMGLEKAKQSDAIAWRAILPDVNNALAHHDGNIADALNTLANEKGHDPQNPDKTYIQIHPDMYTIAREEGKFGPVLDKLAEQNAKTVEKTKDTISALVGGDLKVMSTINDAQAIRSASAIRLQQNPNDVDAQKAYKLSNSMITGDTADKIATKNKERDADYTSQDIADLTAGARNYTMDPEKMRGLPPAVRTRVQANLARDPQGWSEANYKARYDTTNDFRPEGKGGLQVQSLNAFAEHAQEADVLIPAMSNSKSPLYNTAMNEVKTAVGSEQYGKMTAALEAVKDEYLNFLKNAHASSVEEQARAESILNPNMSPSQIHGVIQQMAHIVAARGGQLQRDYTTTMGKPYAGMLDPDNDATLRKWGINTDKMNGREAAPKPPVTPAGATNPVYGADGKTLIGHVVNGKYVALGVQ
jgi:hypothetical protein